METATVEVLLTVVTSPAAVVAVEEVAKLIEVAIVVAFKAIVAAEAVVADAEEASRSQFSLDRPATASSCKF